MIELEELSEAVYEDLNGQIVTVSVARDLYRVFFECDDWNNYDRRRRFELAFNDVPEATATPSSSGFLESVVDHPILWQHNDPHAAMFFSSPPMNALELIGRMHEVHEALFGKWPRQEYRHANSKLLAGGHGLLAQGPLKVIDAYSSAIGDDVRYTVIPSYTPRGGYRLMLFDECYVVFRDVEIIEHEKSAQ